MKPKPKRAASSKRTTPKTSKAPKTRRAQSRRGDAQGCYREDHDPYELVVARLDYYGVLEATLVLLDKTTSAPLGTLFVSGSEHTERVLLHTPSGSPSVAAHPLLLREGAKIAHQFQDQKTQRRLDDPI